MQSALQQAAVALIAEAPPNVLRAIIRQLLDPPEPTATPVRRPAPPPPDEVSDRAKPRAGGQPAAKPTRRAVAKPEDPAWKELRDELRAAMVERAVDWAGLAAGIGMTEGTVKDGVSRSQAPSAGMRAKLRDWIEQAPAVAAVATFRGVDRSNGASAASAH